MNGAQCAGMTDIDRIAQLVIAKPYANPVDHRARRAPGLSSRLAGGPGSLTSLMRRRRSRHKMAASSSSRIWARMT